MKLRYSLLMLALLVPLSQAKLVKADFAKTASAYEIGYIQFYKSNYSDLSQLTLRTYELSERLQKGSISKAQFFTGCKSIKGEWVASSSEFTTLSVKRERFVKNNLNLANALWVKNSIILEKLVLSMREMEIVTINIECEQGFGIKDKTVDYQISNTLQATHFLNEAMFFMAIKMAEEDALLSPSVQPPMPTPPIVVPPVVPIQP